MCHSRWFDRTFAAAAPATWVLDVIRCDVREFRDGGVKRVIYLRKARNSRHACVLEALELFAAGLMPEFNTEVGVREAKKARRLAPQIAARLPPTGE